MTASCSLAAQILRCAQNDWRNKHVVSPVASDQPFFRSQATGLTLFVEKGRIFGHIATVPPLGYTVAFCTLL